MPDAWYQLEREECISLIRCALREESNKQSVDITPYTLLLSKLPLITPDNNYHIFATANWDCLLDNTISDQKFVYAPRWLPNTHVFHINGTIEKGQESNSHRSPFLLPNDAPSRRTETFEANKFFNTMMLSRIMVIIGLSFYYRLDSEGFLWALGYFQDDFPISDSIWIIVDTDKLILESIAKKIKDKMPASNIIMVCAGFREWIENDMHELKELLLLDVKDVK